MGAAVVDDVLGLLILAVVAGAIKLRQPARRCRCLISRSSDSSRWRFGWFDRSGTVIGAADAARCRSSRDERCFVDACDLVLPVAFVGSGKVGLAPIVGAFAAGLILDEVHYKPKGGRKERDLHDLLQPVSTVLVPIFFVLMGLKVDLRLFTHVNILGLAAANNRGHPWQTGLRARCNRAWHQSSGGRFRHDSTW